MNNFSSEYYDQKYFADSIGKQFRRIDGSTDYWGYRNPDGFWGGCLPIVKAWKDIFKLERCNSDTGLCKCLDVGCGRGQFVATLRKMGVEGWGFDFSEWAINNRYKECQDGWIIRHDAIDRNGWPYGDRAFDLVLALDIMEHIYTDDLDFVIDEIYRVSKKWVFLQIATISECNSGYILKKGEKIPIELEVNTVAGHITVQDRQFWVNKLLKDSSGNSRVWKIRDDMVLEFISKVPTDVISNWLKNTMVVLER